MGKGPARILNVGAGHSPWVERQIGVRHRDFVSDRVDIETPTVAEEHLSIARAGRCWTAPIEEMSEVPSDAYGVAFACYVLEHVQDLEAAAREVHRVLRPGGVFVMAVPNPQALQMRISAITPLWFHRLVVGAETFPTVYAYRTLTELAAVFERRGFRWLAVYRISNLAAYLKRWPLMRGIGQVYDWLVVRLGLTALMGDACLVCQAPFERGLDSDECTAAAAARRPPRDQRFTWGPPRRPPWPVG
jgi:SAM-dependent methyltransferase